MGFHLRTAEDIGGAKSSLRSERETKHRKGQPIGGVGFGESPEHRQITTAMDASSPKPTR